MSIRTAIKNIGYLLRIRRILKEIKDIKDINDVKEKYFRNAPEHVKIIVDDMVTKALEVKAGKMSKEEFIEYIARKLGFESVDDFMPLVEEAIDIITEELKE